ncbi:hypothetical protein [Streptomyces sp. CBMA156]|uniref:hypothetical protein n=1 Tax=Streptomyces sp. CBMA156 TaxID=1930280 RepID=UPI001661F0DC|nr:hypothetical protein [Streptomyces sp. CBMA156]
MLLLNPAALTDPAEREHALVRLIRYQNRVRTAHLHLEEGDRVQLPQCPVVGARAQLGCPRGGPGRRGRRDPYRGRQPRPFRSLRAVGLSLRG